MMYMLTSSEETIKNEWKKYEGYTVRPLPSTVSYYQSLIQSYQYKENFLIYGGTPEIRSLFQKYDLDVVLMDRSETVIRAMGQLTQSGLPLSKNEYYLRADWLSTPLHDQYYDFIIGDDAINMVEWHQFDIFLSHAFQLLKTDGVFVCHLLVKPDQSLINKQFNEIVHEYEVGEIKSKYDLASRLNFLCFDQKTYGMSWQKTLAQLGADNLNQFKPDFDFFSLFKYCNSHFYCPPQSEFEKLLKKYFTIEEIFYPHEHDYCLFEPVYLLKKFNKE